MKRTQRGGALVKYLLAILFIALLGYYFYWKANYGLQGYVERLDFPTANCVAFLRQDAGGRTDLFLAKPDGSDPKPLTSDGVPKRAPAWAPNGKSLCYVAETKDTGDVGAGVGYQLFVLGAGQPKQVTYGIGSKDMPLWQPNGKVIAFLTSGSVKVVEENGSNLEQLYPPPHRGTDSKGDDTQNAQPEVDPLNSPPLDYFRWSPGGTAIAGVQVVDGDTATPSGRSGWWSGTKSALNQNQPKMMDPESVVVLPGFEKKPVLLQGSDSNQTRFAWWPDGSRVVVAVSSSQGVHGVLVYRTDPMDQPPQVLFGCRGLTAAPANPAVSPDGTKVAFELWKLSSASDRVLLGIVVLPTSMPKPLIILNTSAVSRVPLFVKGTASMPQWSPDGSRLLYQMPGANGLGRDIWTVAADGTKATNLTKGKGDNFDPVWSPAK